MTRWQLRRAPIALGLICGAHWFGTPARADVIELNLQKSRIAERQVTAGPGASVELCGALRRGQAVAWTFTAEGPLDFNIHYHEGDQVHTPTSRDAVRRGNGRLPVKIDQDYCWMWTNPGSSNVMLRVRLERERKPAQP